MSTLTCIIIEDQTPAQEVLTQYINDTPNLELFACFVSPVNAIEVIANHPIDILFLDIHLPKISGIEMLESLPNPPQTILTTAFSEYALKGYELNVVDYLLKPFSYARFIQAVGKVQRSKTQHVEVQDKHIFVKQGKEIKKVLINEIAYVEANSDFVLLHVNNTRIIANNSLQKMIELLGSDFIRTHKSYAVNLKRIDKIVGNQVYTQTTTIPIGRTYKDELLGRIKTV